MNLVHPLELLQELRRPMMAWTIGTQKAPSMMYNQVTTRRLPAEQKIMYVLPRQPIERPLMRILVQSFGDAYNAAWKKNITARESEPSQVPAVVVAPPVQQHPYSSPQRPSFVSYAFYPQPFMNAAGMHSPSAGSISLPPNAQFSPMENGGSDTPQNKRSPRHCCKCGSKECKGKGGYTFCENTCQDCGKLECRGRNSRRPDERCSEGWV